MRSNVVLEIWEMVQEFVPASKKQQLAQDIVTVFSDQGMDAAWFDDIHGEDNQLDQAIQVVMELDDDDSDEESEHEWED